MPTKTERINAMMLMARQRTQTTATTVRGIARALKGTRCYQVIGGIEPRICPTARYDYALGYGNRSKYAADKYQRDAHARRLEARYLPMAEAQCAALGLLAQDTQRELSDVGATPKAIRGLARLGVPKRIARIAAWLAAPARASEIDTTIGHRVAAGLATAWPFRTAGGKWAGGNHKIKVKLDTYTHAEGGSEKVWSANGKWSGRDSYAILTATPGAILHFPTLRTPDGSIVLDAEMIAPREYRVSWIEQGQGFAINVIAGWLIRGYHVRAATIEQARKKARKVREEAVAAAIVRREKRCKVRREWSRVFVAVEDSIAAGNCQAITSQVAAQAYRAVGASGPCAVRADVLLSLRDDSYVRRALAVASAHQVQA